MFDLNRLIPAGTGFTLIGAEAINKSGQILVNGTDAQRQPRAFLLTPDTSGSGGGGSGGGGSGGGGSGGGGSGGNGMGGNAPAPTGLTLAVLGGLGMLCIAFKRPGRPVPGSGSCGTTRAIDVAQTG
jgi:hypothetical protein